MVNSQKKQYERETNGKLKPLATLVTKLCKSKAPTTAPTTPTVTRACTLKGAQCTSDAQGYLTEVVCDAGTRQGKKLDLSGQRWKVKGGRLRQYVDGKSRSFNAGLFCPLSCPVPNAKCELKQAHKYGSHIYHWLSSVQCFSGEPQVQIPNGQSGEAWYFNQMEHVIQKFKYKKSPFQPENYQGETARMQLNEVCQCPVKNAACTLEPKENGKWTMTKFECRDVNDQKRIEEKYNLSDLTDEELKSLSGESCSCPLTQAHNCKLHRSGESWKLINYRCHPNDTKPTEMDDYHPGVVDFAQEKIIRSEFGSIEPVKFNELCPKNCPVPNATCRVIKNVLNVDPDLKIMFENYPSDMWMVANLRCNKGSWLDEKLKNNRKTITTDRDQSMLWYKGYGTDHVKFNDACKKRR